MTKILVAGATGQQGGAVANQLLDKGHSVRALTRKPDSAAAKALAARGAQIVQCDLLDRASLDAALNGVTAVFAVTTPYGSDPQTETKQGITMADAAKAAGVFVVFSSVGSADRKTGVPHFDSKFEVEKHLRAIGADATIIAPVAFMEGVLYGGEQLKKGVYASALTPTRKLQQIAVADIGAVAVAIFENPDRYRGKRFDLASDENSPEQIVATLSKVSGRPFNFVPLPMAAIRNAMGEDGELMFKWFESTGYSADRSALAREFPTVKWTTFEQFAQRPPLKRLLT